MRGDAAAAAAAGHSVTWLTLILGPIMFSDQVFLYGRILRELAVANKHQVNS